MKLPTTLAEITQQIYDQEGSGYPGDSLVQLELRPGYNRARDLKLEHMRAINEAHLLMLIQQEIIEKSQGIEILRTLESIDYNSYQNKSYSGEYEDLFFEIEAELIKRTDGLGGNLHLGRSRNDMGVCLARMLIREELLVLIKELTVVANTTLRFAQEHKDTLYVVHTHTQHAQPSVLRHYFLGAHDVFHRDLERMQRAYQRVNQSPMGAAAITTSGFPLDREAVSKLIGCDNFILNAYDAIGDIDYFTDTATAIGLASLNLGRIVTDMTVWATEELQMIRVADGYISTSSIMPQKRNPIALEHLRASLSMVKGMSDSILLAFMKSPYGDISDYEDVEEPMVNTIRLLIKNYKLFNAVLGTLQIEKDVLKARAYSSFSVVTEMADQLYREFKIPFRVAHHLTATLVKELVSKQQDIRDLDEELFVNLFLEVTGQHFKGNFDLVRNSFDPIAFVEKRDVEGGTSPRAMHSMLQVGEIKMDKALSWILRSESHLKETAKERKALINQLLAQ